VYKDLDRRSVEQQNKLKSATECLDRRLVEIRKLVASNTDSLGSALGEINRQLGDIAATLREIAHGLRPVTPRPIAPRPPGSDPLLESLQKVALEQNRILTDILARIRPAETAGAVPTTSAVGGNTFNIELAGNSQPGGSGDIPEKRSPDQIKPETPILYHYSSPQVTVDMAVVTVPDPRVPRHKRQYDNAITAITQGMLRSGYVLDLYAFPWRDAEPMQREANRGAAVDMSILDALRPTSQVHTDVEHDDRFGLMLFRRDDWRARKPGTPPAKGIHVRALYVVAETGTYGVQAMALKAAIRTINNQISAAISAAETASKAVIAARAAGAAAAAEHDPPEGVSTTRQAAEATKAAAAKAAKAAADAYEAAKGANSPDGQNPSAAMRPLDSLVDRKVDLVGHPSCSNGVGSGTVSQDLVIFGPTFSGSVDSIRQAIDDLNAVGAVDQISSICLLSASATAATNGLGAGEKASTTHGPRHPGCQVITASTPGRRSARMQYCSLATDDDSKIDFVVDLSKSLGIATNRIAVVYEATVFGDQLCKGYLGRSNERDAGTVQLCSDALTLSFPVNIADVRYGLRAKAQERELQRALQNKQTISLADDRLSLEDGAENGSEFPESQESPLTAASTELVLDRILDEVRSRKPQLIIVVATDVRDRLFLIERMSSIVGNALFVDLGADRLLAHPDFIHGTRGTLALSTASLRMGSCPFNEECNGYGGRNLDMWSTDEEALLFYAVATWPAAPSGSPVFSPWISECGDPAVSLRYEICPHVVTRAGLYSRQDSTADSAGIKLSILVTIAILLTAGLFALCWYTIGGSGGLAAQGLGPNWKVVSLVALSIIAALALSMVIANGAAVSAAALAVVIVLVWPTLLGFYWPNVASWSAFGLLLSTAVCAIPYVQTPLDRLLGGVPGPHEYMQPLLDSLSASLGGGLAYPLAVGLACVALVISLWIALAAARAIHRSDWVLGVTFGPDFAQLKSPLQWAGRASFAATSLLVFSGLLMFDAFNGRRVTVFGLYADLSALLADLATTAVGIAMIAGTIGSGLRIERLSQLIMHRRHGKAGFDMADPTAQPLLWTGRAGPQRPNLAATPAIATAGGAGDWIAQMRAPANATTYSTDVANCLTAAQPSAKEAGALYALFADELMVYRASIAGVIVCTLASGGIVYLFPVSQATPLTVINMLVLIAGGLASAYFTVSFEGDRILSNVLCNREQKREWSIRLFASMIAPFVFLVVFVAVAQLPGVIDAGGGLLEVIFGFLKPGGK
jgi:hypothetical protein